MLTAARVTVFLASAMTSGLVAKNSIAITQQQPLSHLTGDSTFYSLRHDVEGNYANIGISASHLCTWRLPRPNRFAMMHPIMEKCMDDTRNPASDSQPVWAHYSVLVVDDEPGMLSFLQRALASRCGSVEGAGSVEEARPMLQRRRFDLIILDIALPGLSGIDWLHELRQEGYAGDVVLMTAYADLDTAIDALRAGAADFLLKPFSVAVVLNALQRCFERSRLARENFVLRREISTRSADVDGIVGQSELMHTVCDRLKRIAPTPATVLLTGESGTGKQVAARALHRMSPRADGPFVPINCAAIASELIDSQLFGHVKGAFTGAKQNREGLFYYARGGTLFLDEIGELPLPAQAKLLRVLQEGELERLGDDKTRKINVRIIAATNVDLQAAVKAGRFRSDLYYRLNVYPVLIPPLRERLSDIPLLIEAMLQRFGALHGKRVAGITDKALRALKGYA